MSGSSYGFGKAFIGVEFSGCGEDDLAARSAEGDDWGKGAALTMASYRRGRRISREALVFISHSQMRITRQPSSSRSMLAA